MGLKIIFNQINDSVEDSYLAKGLIAVVAVAVFFVIKYDSIPPFWQLIGMIFFSFVSGVLFHFLSLIFETKWHEKIEKEITREACRSLTIPETLEAPEDIEKYLGYMVHRYSSENISNRFSDGIGSLNKYTALIITNGITIFYLAIVIYAFWSENFIDLVLLWVPFLLRILFYVGITSINVLCKMIFNRYPGEAKTANKHIDNVMQYNTASSGEELRAKLFNLKS